MPLKAQGLLLSLAAQVGHLFLYFFYFSSQRPVAGEPTTVTLTMLAGDGLSTAVIESPLHQPPFSLLCFFQRQQINRRR